MKPSRAPWIFLICNSQHAAVVFPMQAGYSSFRQEKRGKGNWQRCVPASLDPVCQEPSSFPGSPHPIEPLTYISLASTGSPLLTKESGEVRTN